MRCEVKITKVEALNIKKKKKKKTTDWKPSTALQSCNLEIFLWKLERLKKCQKQKMCAPPPKKKLTSYLSIHKFLKRILNRKRRKFFRVKRGKVGTEGEEKIEGEGGEKTEEVRN